MSRADDNERIVLGQVSTRARLFGRSVDQLAVERRLDEVARGALPDALGEALGRALNGQDGIVRIDSIDVEFAIDRRALDGGELAARWAARLGAAIAERMRRGHGGGIARFASHGQFVAAYLEHRFAVAPHPPFAFADFAPLDHLTPAEAAIELLAARPAYLAELALQGQRRGRPTWLADRLHDSHAKALIDRIFADGALPAVPEPAAFRAMMADAPAAWQLHGADRAALALALSRLSATEGIGADVVLTTLMLSRLVAALDLIGREAPRSLGSIASGDAVDPADIAGPSTALGKAAMFLRGLLADRRWRALAALVAEAMTPAAPRRDGGRRGDDAIGEKRRAAPSPSLASPFAGTVLVLPVLRTLGVTDRLHPDQLRALLLAMIDPAEAMRDTADALAAFLVPRRDPDPPRPWPALPDGEGAEPSAQRWAAFALGQFASRLPGLQDSTPGYLRRQFLHGRGELIMEEKALVARLARPALVIVLTMAGMTGDQGALPWLKNRRLRIELA